LYDKLVSLQKSPFIILFKGSQNTIFLEEALKLVLADKKDISKLPRQSEWWIRNNFLFF